MEKKYYLLAVLDDEAQKRLTALSEQLTKEGFEYTRYTPYHITLWDSDNIDEQSLAHFKKICHTTPAFETALGSIGLFGLAVAFLTPLPCLPLITLEQRICGQINDASDGWVPHVTMRMGEPEYIKQAVPIIAGLFTPFSVRIEHVELYECGEGYANLVHRYCLCRN
ncbi:MAG: 2'-5' RNA ligase family protein [Clostridiales bacterium]|nr:2'-5' RNA ligase family protein [Clostridiales bacterium]